MTRPVVADDADDYMLMHWLGGGGGDGASGANGNHHVGDSFDAHGSSAGILDTPAASEECVYGSSMQSGFLFNNNIYASGTMPAYASGGAMPAYAPANTSAGPECGADYINSVYSGSGSFNYGNAQSQPQQMLQYTAAAGYYAQSSSTSSSTRSLYTPPTSAAEELVGMNNLAADYECAAQNNLGNHGGGASWPVSALLSGDQYNFDLESPPPCGKKQRMYDDISVPRPPMPIYARAQKPDEKKPWKVSLIQLSDSEVEEYTSEIAALSCVTVVTPTVAQKSYGSEKRFFCPPPLLRMRNCPSSARSLGSTRRRGSAGTHDDTAPVSVIAFPDMSGRWGAVGCGGTTSVSKDYRHINAVDGSLDATAGAECRVLALKQMYLGELAKYQTLHAELYHPPTQTVASLLRCVADASMALANSTRSALNARKDFVLSMTVETETDEGQGHQAEADATHIGTFSSAPILLVSKPSKKKKATSNHLFASPAPFASGAGSATSSLHANHGAVMCKSPTATSSGHRADPHSGALRTQCEHIMYGGLVSLFSRVKSQNVTTRCLEVELEGGHNGNDGQLVATAKDVFWDAFVIQSATGKQGSILYDDVIHLQCSRTGWRSPALVIRHVDSVGADDAQEDAASEQQKETVSHLQKILLQIHGSDNEYFHTEQMSKQPVRALSSHGCSIESLTWTITGASVSQYRYLDFRDEEENTLPLSPMPVRIAVREVDESSFAHHCPPVSSISISFQLPLVGLLNSSSLPIFKQPAVLMTQDACENAAHSLDSLYHFCVYAGNVQCPVTADTSQMVVAAPPILDRHIADCGYQRTMQVNLPTLQWCLSNGLWLNDLRQRFPAFSCTLTKLSRGTDVPDGVGTLPTPDGSLNSSSRFTAETALGSDTSDGDDDEDGNDGIDSDDDFSANDDCESPMTVSLAQVSPLGRIARAEGAAAARPTKHRVSSDRCRHPFNSNGFPFGFGGVAELNADNCNILELSVPLWIVRSDGVGYPSDTRISYTVTLQ